MLAPSESANAGFAPRDSVDLVLFVGTKMRIPADEALGKRFGRLVVLELFKGPQRTMARAACDCGHEWVGTLNRLRNGNTKSCGCQMMKFEDITGVKFGRWTALNCVSKSGKGGPTLWRCKCECGSESAVQAGALKRGASLSCGCLAVELKIRQSTVHGMTHSSEYNTWQGIKGRCFDPKDKDYKNYGARGISMHLAWVNDFVAFYAYVGPKPSRDHSIERSNNDAGYVPGNISWQTRKVQANNNRGNHLVTLDGVTKTLAIWCEIYNVNYPVVHQRIAISGWDPLRALTTPTIRPNRGTRQKGNHQADSINNTKPAFSKVAERIE